MPCGDNFSVSGTLGSELRLSVIEEILNIWKPKYFINKSYSSHHILD